MNPFEAFEEERRRWDLEDAGIDLMYNADFLASEDADRLFAALMHELSWKRETIRTAGGPCPLPRLTSWHADEGIDYSYSGLTHPWRDWTPGLIEVRDRLTELIGVRLNGVLANLYENERDSVSPHADDERSLEAGAPIASVSLGEVRDFVVQHQTSKARYVIPLGHGSLLLMSGDTQKVAQHSLPKIKRPCGPRINLTFRRVMVP